MVVTMCGNENITFVVRGFDTMISISNLLIKSIVGRMAYYSLFLLLKKLKYDLKVK